MSITFLYWVAFIGGFIVGAVVMFIIFRLVRTVGTLKIDHSNPEKDIYRFVIDNDVLFKNPKRITLKVDNNADLSHE